VRVITTNILDFFHPGTYHDGELTLHKSGNKTKESKVEITLNGLFVLLDEHVEQ
jgi:hypothetical protein